MGKLTLDDLRKMRESLKNEMDKRDGEKDIRIVVGMGTCGIAAGAKKTLEAFIEDLDKRSLKNVSVKQTGCMGNCNVEPTVEVFMPEMPATLYGNVSADVARKIVQKHILERTLLNDHIQDKPSIDIVKH
ncbi:MAG TPA: (2Fe-2S) ferredoxin domain-containing protein [Candidatus Omnitrophota bacterium]|nr:(2Fe-2S) ferredoxin domain-containing protein [Candidatus Omnitrophota bacterium]HQL41672.1 (2Fe-2S) ferredoxin domain-containing protein [Candidatus Omnitrophota bacterium]